MVLRNIQRVEIVVVGFDLATVFNRIAQGNKDVLDPFANDRDRVDVSAAWTPARQSNVDRFAGCARGFEVGFEREFGLLDLRSNFRFVLLDELTKTPALARGNPADQFLRRS